MFETELEESVHRLKDVAAAVKENQASLSGRDCDIDLPHHLEVVLRAACAAPSSLLCKVVGAGDSEPWDDELENLKDTISKLEALAEQRKLPYKSAATDLRRQAASLPFADIAARLRATLAAPSPSVGLLGEGEAALDDAGLAEFKHVLTLKKSHAWESEWHERLGSVAAEHGPGLVARVAAAELDKGLAEAHARQSADLLKQCEAALEKAHAKLSATPAVGEAGGAGRWAPEAEHRTGNIFRALVPGRKGEDWNVKDAHWDSNGPYWNHADHFEVLDVKYVLVREDPEWPDMPPAWPLTLTDTRWVFVADTPELKDKVNELLSSAGLYIPEDTRGPRYKYVLWNSDRIDALYSDWTKPRWGKTVIDLEQFASMVAAYANAVPDMQNGGSLRPQESQEGSQEPCAPGCRDCGDNPSCPLDNAH